MGFPYHVTMGYVAKILQKFWGQLRGSQSSVSLPTATDCKNPLKTGTTRLLSWSIVLRCLLYTKCDTTSSRTQAWRNNIFVNKPTWRAIFSYVFISILYMFRAAMCPSSGKLIVSMRHLVYVTLCRWPSGMQVRTELMSFQTVFYKEWHIPGVALIQ